MAAKKNSEKKVSPKKIPAKKAAPKKEVHHEHHNILERVEEVVEEKMEQVLHGLNKEQAEHVLHDFVGAFKGAEWQDYLMFVL